MMSEYDGLIKRLQNAAMWADKGLVITPSLVLQAVDAIENLQGQLSVCLEGTKVRFVKNDDGTEEVRFENQWIPVTERLPENVRKSYLCLTDTGYHCEMRWTNNVFGLLESDNKWGWSVADVPQYCKVTHWMPLPSCPEPSEEETE